MTSILAQRAHAARRRRPPSPPAEPNGVPAGVAGGRAARTPPDASNLRLLAKALTIRRTEQRLLDLFTENKLAGTVHTCIGQEWTAVAVAEALRPGDYIFSNHRSHGHYLAWTDDVEGLVAELMGRTTGPCAGRGGSQHLCRDGFFSNGVQGGTVPVAAGLAMAKRLEGGIGIGVVFIGDGTLGEGVVYETFNLAAKWSLPLLVVLEDNGVAQSTDMSETLAGTIRGRAEGFGLEIRHADTWHPTQLIRTAADAVRRVRQTRQPLLLHVKTYRLAAHSKGDDDRDPEEVRKFAERDTLNQLLTAGTDQTQHLITAIDRRLDEAIERAAAAPFASVTVDPPEVPRCSASACDFNPVEFEPLLVVEAIRSALDDAMADDDRIILLGEDIRDPYGGAFKVTAGLSERYGDRVRNTPISEAAIVGLGNGLALAGWRPVVEIMFGDFLMLAADQIINHAAKFAWMYNDQVQVPIIIRTPMGGYRGYGPTHSQSLEKHLLGLPGTRVLALHKRFCPYQVYRRLLTENDRPTLVVENKQLYTQRTDPTPPPDCTLTATAAPFPTVRITPAEDQQLTVVTYGGLVGMVEAATAELRESEELACDLLIPTQLYPLDAEPIVESVRRTGRLLVVEEGQGFGGFGSELIAQLAADPRLAGCRFGRVHAAACPLPAARPAEQTLLPATGSVIQAAINLVTRD